METSTIFTGDAVTPLLTALDDPGVVAAGWQGANVDDDWRGFHDAGPGRVEALLGYLFAVRRDAALTVAADGAGPLAKSRFYRNVDLEFSYALRESGGQIVVVPDLPVQQTRHRGYHDSDPAYRDRESKRNYDRFLARFRGREDLRLT
jgi:GT2 family glycosyltransferase